MELSAEVARHLRLTRLTKRGFRLIARAAKSGVSTGKSSPLSSYRELEIVYSIRVAQELSPATVTSAKSTHLRWKPGHEESFIAQIIVASCTTEAIDITQ